MGVHCDLRVEDAAMGVGIHLQRVQQLSVVLHSEIVCTALFRDQLGSALWRQTNHEKDGASNTCMNVKVLLFFYLQIKQKGIKVTSATDN